jgi:hypothetical protein
MCSLRSVENKLVHTFLIGLSNTGNLANDVEGDRSGVMQLVPTAQHVGRQWSQLFHPGRVGGYKLWGAEF